MRVLTVNSGSSSIKLSLFDMGPGEALILSGGIEGIASAAGRFRISGPDGAVWIGEERPFRNHDEAFDAVTSWLASNAAGRTLDAVGHRVVHGGSAYVEPHVVTPDLLAALDELVPFAPDHLPHELAAIREIARFYPDITQAACFDTAFHRTMPDVAQQYALPGEVRRHGVLRYGFHGLSYEYILNELKRSAGPVAAAGRVIIAHLGNGASMGAFRNGRSMDTTMGFTPAGGLVMSTRSGDLDPGVVVYLLKEKGMDAAALNRMVNKESGLLGVSGISSDMKELLDRETKEPRAAGAVELFCYQARKFIGALAAVLGGLDTLVFTGGIGENAPPIRKRICRDLEFLGFRLDDRRNDADETIISEDGSTVSVRVMKTNEELMIARHTFGLVGKSGGCHEQEAHCR
jgi:acetate kinase